MNLNYPLVPGQMIFALAPGIEDHWVATWSNLFRKAWTLVPLDARDVLLAYWKSKIAQGQHSPPIVFQDGISPPCTEMEGHKIIFFVHCLTEWCEQMALSAIIHELAHVFLFATGDSDHWPQPDDKRARPDLDKAREDRVAMLMTDWGIDQKAALKWAAEYASRMRQAFDEAKKSGTMSG